MSNRVSLGIYPIARMVPEVEDGKTARTLRIRLYESSADRDCVKCHGTGLTSMPIEQADGSVEHSFCGCSCARNEVVNADFDAMVIGMVSRKACTFAVRKDGVLERGSKGADSSLQDDEYELVLPEGFVIASTSILVTARGDEVTMSGNVYPRTT